MMKGLNYAEYKLILQAYGITAALNTAIGNQKKAEAAYVNYIHLIEKFFHKDSLETSNAYYLVGVYYFEQSLTHKAVACFGKSLAIRRKKFGNSHPSCSDCLVNLGILYKLRGYNNRAEEALSSALQIRRESIGLDSLPTANTLEELGKFYLETERYKQSY